MSEFERAYDLFKPRRATVTANQPGEVRVRLWRDDAEPTRWFPSVFASTPIDTNGVLVRINREESIFIPEAVVTASPGSAAWGSISGTLSAQTDLQSALNGKANSSHTHGAVDITSGTLAIARIPTGTTGTTVALGNHTHAWNDITSKPATFPPSSHNHDGVYVKPDDLGDLALLDEVGVAEIDATGTPGSATFLRGDGSWAGVPVAGNPEWGDIGGTLSDQTDLMNALAIGTTVVGRGLASSLESTTVVDNTYANASVLYSGQWQSLVDDPPVGGLWDVALTLSATVYRSVATGGVRIWVGDGTEGSSALGRVFPQSAGYGLVTSHVLRNVPPSATIDIRLAGLSTAATTHLISRALSIVAVRKA